MVAQFREVVQMLPCCSGEICPESNRFEPGMASYLAYRF